mgnify:CR=1 FL=1
MSKLEVDKITPQSGTTLTIGDSGDTIVIDSTSVSGAKLAAPTLVGSASSAGSILFKEDTDNGTNAVTLKGPAATADVTLNLPAANDTIVGRQTTDTLTNKTINASQLVDASIATGKLADDAVTYAKMQDTSTANRVLGAASAGTISEVQIATDMIVDANITSGKIADNAITLAKMASGTDGNIISYDASGNPVAVATGSSGQVLTSAGAGAVPSFQTASGETNTPTFRAYLNNNLNMNSSADTTAVFDAETFDPQSVYNTSNGRFTIPSNQAGKYFVGACIRCSVNSTNTSFNLLKNMIFQYNSSNSLVQEITEIHNGMYTNQPTFGVSGLFNCSVGDYFLVKNYFNGSGYNMVAGSNATWFNAFKIIE